MQMCLLSLLNVACILLVQLIILTLNLDSSVLEMESALAIMGMILTLVSSFFMHTKSIDFNLEQKHYITVHFDASQYYNTNSQQLPKLQRSVS